MPTKSRPSDKDYRALGKAVEKALVTDYSSFVDHKRSFYWMSFSRGLLAGFGGVIGATLVVAIVIWLLSIFGNLPVIGDFFNTTKETIQQ